VVSCEDRPAGLGAGRREEEKKRRREEKKKRRKRPLYLRVEARKWS
jgi:hypothetical protein